MISGIRMQQAATYDYSLTKSHEEGDRVEQKTNRACHGEGEMHL